MFGDRTNSGARQTTAVSSRESVWWDLLSASGRGLLHRRDDLPSTADVVVVGGGMLGVAIAWFARQANLGRVVLVEAEFLGAGASGGAAGLLVPDAHNGTDPAHFVELGRRSLGLWSELDRLIPGGVGLLEIEWLGLEPHPPGWLAPAHGEHLAADQVAGLVPGLATPSAGVLIRHQGWLNPLQAPAAVASQIDTVRVGAAVTRTLQQGGGGVEVMTSAGRVSAGSVIFATGGPPPLPGLDIPVGRVRGPILVTAATEQAMHGSVAPVATRLPDGRLLVGGTEDVDDSDEVDPEIARVLRHWLDSALPSAARTKTTHTWCCFRPSHPDHLPVVDRAPGLDSVWFTSGHYRTGILMAPAIGDALVSWIQSGQRPANVAELAASRFSLG